MYENISVDVIKGYETLADPGHLISDEQLRKLAEQQEVICRRRIDKNERKQIAEQRKGERRQRVSHVITPQGTAEQIIPISNISPVAVTGPEEEQQLKLDEDELAKLLLETHERRTQLDQEEIRLSKLTMEEDERRSKLLQEEELQRQRLQEEEVTYKKKLLQEEELQRKRLQEEEVTYKKKIQEEIDAQLLQLEKVKQNIEENSNGEDTVGMLNALYQDEISDRLSKVGGHSDTNRPVGTIHQTKRDEMQYWRKKATLEEQSSVRQTGVMITLVANFIESLNNSLGGKFIKSTGLSNMVESALEEGEFDVAIRSFASNPQASKFLKNPISSFVTVFGGILMAVHVRNIKDGISNTSKKHNTRQYNQTRLRARKPKTQPKSGTNVVDQSTGVPRKIFGKDIDTSKIGTTNIQQHVENLEPLLSGLTKVLDLQPKQEPPLSRRRLSNPNQNQK